MKNVFVFICILCCICWAYNCEIEQLKNTNEVQASCVEKETNYLFQITIKKDASELVWMELSDGKLTIYRTVKANNGIIYCYRDETDEYGVSNKQNWSGKNCSSPIEQWNFNREFYGF